jgi:hypothetical protein
MMSTLPGPMRRLVAENIVATITVAACFELTGGE